MADTYCPRCGYHKAARPDSRVIEFCFYCSDGKADESRATRLLEAAAMGDRDARRLLSELTDRRALGVLLGASNHEDPAVRRAVWTALAGVADPTAREAAISAAADRDPQIADASTALLARIGEADALAHLLGVPGADWFAAQALAWLGDERALDPLIGMLRRPESLGHTNLYWSPVAALAQLGDPRAIPPLAELLDGKSEPGPGNHAASLVSSALNDLGGPVADRAVSAARERLGRLYSYSPLDPRRRPMPAPFAFRAPQTSLRSEPKLSLELREAASPVDTATTKFGGQPNWLTEPTWPLTTAETPMTFFAQFAIPWMPGAMAYLFVDIAGDSSFDPESGDSALIVQAGPPPRTPWQPAPIGPSYPSQREYGVTVYRGRPHSRLAEYVPTLEPGLDPTDWSELADTGDRSDDRDWNKVGGTPLFLQEEQWPSGDRWRLLFQFSAWQIGHEFADGAECYGFVSDEGTGAFLWQCS